MATLPDDPTRGLLGDIIAYGERAVRHLGDLDASAFAADEKTQDSVVGCYKACWQFTFDPLIHRFSGK